MSVKINIHHLVYDEHIFCLTNTNTSSDEACLDSTQYLDCSSFKREALKPIYIILSGYKQTQPFNAKDEKRELFLYLLFKYKF